MKKFLLGILFLVVPALTINASEINSATQINWKNVTGNGTPTALGILCNQSTIGRPFQNTGVTPNTHYSCDLINGTPTWELQQSSGGATLPTSSLVFGLTSTTSRAATTSDLATLLATATNCNAAGAYNPFTNSCIVSSGGISGLTNGFIPLAGSGTTLTGNSHIDDGRTTTNTLTLSENTAIIGLLSINSIITGANAGFSLYPNAGDNWNIFALGSGAATPPHSIVMYNASSGKTVFSAYANAGLNFIETFASGMIGWDSDASNAGAAPDTAFSRLAPGIVGLGNGTLNDTSGTFKTGSVWLTSLGSSTSPLCTTTGGQITNAGCAAGSGATLPSSALVFGLTSTTSRAATTSDLATLLSTASNCNAAGAYNPFTNSCLAGGTGTVTTTGTPTTGTIPLFSGSTQLENSLLSDSGGILSYSGTSSTHGIVFNGVSGIFTPTAGVFDFGNGLSGNTSGSIIANTITVGGLTPGSYVQAGTGGLLTTASYVSDTTLPISSGTLSALSCSSTATLTMNNLTTSMVVLPGYNGDPSSFSGWGISSGMRLYIWPSAANTASWRVCNISSGPITYPSITFIVGAR